MRSMSPKAIKSWQIALFCIGIPTFLLVTGFTLWVLYCALSVWLGG